MVKMTTKQKTSLIAKVKDLSTNDKYDDWKSVALGEKENNLMLVRKPSKAKTGLKPISVAFGKTNEKYGRVYLTKRKLELFKELIEQSDNITELLDIVDLALGKVKEENVEEMEVMNIYG